MTWCVVVTYGNRPNFVYANGIRHAQDAYSLLDAAKARGYHDARIEDEERFFKTHGAQQRGTPYSPSIDKAG